MLGTSNQSVPEMAIEVCEPMELTVSASPVDGWAACSTVWISMMDWVEDCIEPTSNERKGQVEWRHKLNSYR